MTRVCLRSRPRPPRSIQAERDELLSAAHHPVFFMFAFFLDKKKESAHTPKSFTRLKAPLHVFFFSSLCARVHKCLTSTHAHQTLHQPCVVSQEGNIKGPVAVGMRSLETSVVQQRQLESPVATGSLEKEVGLQNKEGLENKRGGPADGGGRQAEMVGGGQENTGLLLLPQRQRLAFGSHLPVRALL
ncbi:hypothetical protein FQA47_011557 [Oryzias melastigma]|uniref:Uncharacterized protein n=1 Tax=Oryzias melastigma TaxID=30732 RepID=A0A834BSS6_ORYME|nr:hypothetical protein FQA47_011557 [Oryzias melastigma]